MSDFSVPIRLANGAGNYPDALKFMADYDWLTAIIPGSYIINGGFESWTGGATFTNPSNGASLADSWTLSKGGTAPATADCSRDATVVDTGIYSMKWNITLSGSSDSYLNTTRTALNVTSFRGSNVAFGAAVYASTGNKIRLRITDGTVTAYSSYHTGSTSWETLRVMLTVSPTATTVTVYIDCQSDFAGAFYIDSAFLYLCPIGISTYALQNLTFQQNREAVFSQSLVSLIPSIDNSLDLGSGSYAWRYLYLGTGLVMREIGGSDTVTINVPSVAAASVYTIPDVGTSASFVMTEGAQVVNGAKSFGSRVSIPNGTFTNPGLIFTSETNTGIYLNTTNDMRFSVGGQDKLTLTAGAMYVQAPRIELSDGSAALPAYTFSLDAAGDTGMYRVSENILGFTTNAVQRLQISTTNILASLPIYLPNGSAALPSLTFSSDTSEDTGLFWISDNIFGFSTNGTERLRISTAAITSTLPEILPNGSAAAPSLTGADTASGLYFATNAVSVSAGGANRVTVSNTAVSIADKILLPNGTAAAPSLSFTADSDNGVYSTGSNNISIAAGGGQAAKWETNACASLVRHYFVDGTAALPAISFSADSDTGIYRSSSNEMCFSSGGVDKWHISASLLYPVANNSYDFGTTGYNIRNLYTKAGIVFTETGSGDDYVQLEPPASVTTSYRVAVPADAPTALNQVMRVSSLGTPNVLSWGSVSGSSLGFNYIANPDAEIDTSGWATYADAAGTQPTDGTGGSPTVTWTRTTSSPLRGVGTFLMTKDAANRQGEGASYAFTLDSADKSKPIYVSFDYLAAGSYADNDVSVWLYDVTNAVVIQPAPYLVKLTSLPENFACVFQTPSNSTSYRLIFHVGSTNASAWTLKIDNVRVSPNNAYMGSPITNWVNYTPTISAGFGTPSSVSFYYRRVGDSLDIQGTFIAGTLASSVASVTLPSGLSIDYTKISTNAGMSVVGKMVAGHTAEAITNDLSTVMVDGSTASTVFFSRYTASTTSFAKDNADTVCATNGIVTLWCRVPIAGWGSTVLMSDNADSRVVSMRYNTGSGTVSGSYNLVTYTTKVYDTHNAYSSGVYTVPLAGIYRVSAAIVASNTWVSGQSFNAVIYKNGSNYAASGFRIVNAITDNVTAAIETTVQCVAGDALSIYNIGASGATIGGSSTSEWVDITRISGPSQIAATETIGCRYFLSGGVTADTTTPIDFSTRDFDTHGAVTTGSGWKFTAPVAGIYRISSPMLTTSASIVTMSVYKNGTLNSYLTDVDNVRISCGSTMIKLLAGDYIDLRFSASRTTAASTYLSVSIERIGN